MSSLSDVYYSKPRNGTDKGEYHDYINGYYTTEFLEANRNDKVNLLEIGIYYGDSIRLWLEWFTNGNITGVEYNTDYVARWEHFKGEFESKATIIGGDGYSLEVLNRFEDNHFDYIIDDGPHTLESQVDAIDCWVPKLKVGGKLIIEDIQDINHIQTLTYTSQRHNVVTRTIDLRENKGTRDDIIFEVTKQA